MIDEIDRKILTILQENGRTSNAEIARGIGMAPSGVLERIRKLEQKKIILGYETRIDPKALGLELTAFIHVSADEAVGSNEGGRIIADIPGVQEVHYCAGRDAYLVKARAENTEKLADLLQQIGRTSLARDTNSTIVLRTIKETTHLPIGAVDDVSKGNDQSD